MEFLLADTPLFQGITEGEIQSLLQCLGADRRKFPKGAVILSEGSVTESLGIVLSGMALISCSDVWGNNSVLGSAAPEEEV